ncbi:MAG: DNA replication/repair protein RecF [Bacteroidetes bacterium]|nr:DNA replication/repair protein RecF [Bacteroidota bacterium]HET6244941.1 DNA replication/repair protein RecF [Bacteroidia bacterium]
MQLHKLFLINFKNYSEADINFSAKFNCFVGDNGQGKTNLLDAIHYLSFCKSFFNPIDSQNILNDAPFFVIQGEFINEENTENIYCGLKRNEKKKFKRNQKEYSKLADHIGLIPLVLISPADAELITDGSEFRRKFMDSAIAQHNKTYLEKLITYNKILSQRNALLKNFNEKRYFDKDSLEIWDAQLITAGEYINKKRGAFIREFLPLFQKFYIHISGNNETVGIEYESKLNENSFQSLLLESLPKDRNVLYTTCGIHKDDLVFKINEFPIKKMGSQGQQKTFLLALKLAQFEYLKKIKKSLPLLLLDDIFDKLDQKRVARLMEIVGSDDFGQIFITDTNSQRISEILFNLQLPFKTFKIDKGTVVEELKTSTI